jgi:CheY-like chemotaxis protein
MGAVMHETEPMLQAALASMTPLAEIVRPRLLVHDDYPAVADMLEMILRSRYRVVKSTSLPATIGLLGSAQFDGFVTELDLKESVQGLELARRAVELQPGLRTIFTASAARIRNPEDDPLIRRSPLLPKPFNVREVLAAIESAVPAE